MSRYDDDYDDEDERDDDDEIDGEDGVRRSTSNPFSRPSSVRGAGLPQQQRPSQERPPNNADGSVPSPIRSGGGGSTLGGGSLGSQPNRPNNSQQGGSGGSNSSLFPNRPNNSQQTSGSGGNNNLLPNRPNNSQGGSGGASGAGGSSPSGVQPYQRTSPAPSRPGDERNDRSSNSMGGSGFGSRDRQDDDRTSRLTGGLGGLTSRLNDDDEKKDNHNKSGGLGSRFGGGDKKDDQRDNKSGGGLGGLTSRFGGGDKKDNQPANKPNSSLSNSSSNSSGGGLGGLTSRFGGGDKKDNQPANKSSSSSSGGLGGLTSRFGGGDKKDDKKDNNAGKSGGIAGGLGGLTSRFGGGDKKNDPNDHRSPGSGSSFGSSSSSSLGGSGGSFGSNRPGQSQNTLGGSRPGQSQNTYGGSSSSSSSRSTFGGNSGLGGSSSAGGSKAASTAKKAAGLSLGARLAGLNPFGKKDERSAPPKSRTSTSKAPRVDQGGLSLDNKLDILGVSLLLGSLVLLLSSLSPTKGALTESVNHGFSYLFGWGAVGVLLVVFGIGVWLILRHFGDEAPVISRTRLIGLAMLFLGVLVAAQFIDAFQYRVGANQDYLHIIKTVFLPTAYDLGRGGGWVGGEIYFQLLSNFGEIGGFMVVVGWLIVSLMLALSLSASDLAIVVVSNFRNLKDVLSQRRQQATAQRAAKQQALATAAQQISVSKPPEAQPLTAGAAVAGSPALPAPSAETAQQDQRHIPITTGGRTSSIPFGAQGAEVAASIAAADMNAVPVRVIAAQEKPGRFSGIGSKVRGVLPSGKLPIGKDSEKAAEDEAFVEKAASLRGRLFSREKTAAGESDSAGAASSVAASPVSANVNGERLTPVVQPERATPVSANGGTVGAATAAASQNATGSETPVRSTADTPAEQTPRLGDLLGAKPNSTPLTSSGSPTSGGSLTSSGSPSSGGSPSSSPSGVQPYQRPPLARPDTGKPDMPKPADIPAASQPTAPVGVSSQPTAPLARPDAAIPDLQSRMRALREVEVNGNTTTRPQAPPSTPASGMPPASSSASPAYGKPADPPFAIPQRSGVTDNGIVRSKPPRNWEKPDPADLLSVGVDQEADKATLVKRVHIIEETLASFGAPGRVVDVRTGPVVTQFGVEPDYVPGRGGKKNRVKVGAIAALDKDLQLALGAKAIRIEAPVPGKGYVGVEVPNEKAEIVHLRDVLESPEFKKIKSPLAIALGQGVDGTPVAADLASMPHLLIAGTTGSGKSVCVNTIIASILLNNSPRQVKFVMVDPKRVELTQYNGIPHLIAPVVVELERIVSVLKWVTREMDERYRRFSTASARNIEDYNKHLPQTEEPMPYIVVIIDELADLMMMAPDDTERVITRIAALARATGIHLVIATQRPSVDVVTGLIKANFPARVAFAVAGNTDSRVILDQPGAERLLGKGDMLYMSGDAPAPVRLQGVFVSDTEIGNITHFWRSQMTESDMIAASRPIGGSVEDAGRSEGGVILRNSAATARPQEAFWDDDEDDSEDDDEIADGEDEMYEQAVDMVRRLNKASVSLLQRRLRIGYTRAARLIDTMEERGVIGPPVDGAKPREVLPVR